MALILKDRVQENSTTSGTGTLTLSGAVPGFQTFSTAIGNGNTTFYTLYDNVAQVWEVGIGTVGAGTLARTTVLANSSGGTSPLTLAGNSIAVWCDYSAEKAVNLDASGNVSPLGTIASGTWQGTTVGVSYGGTGVTASSGANSVVLRDADQNINVNSVTQNLTKTVSAAGTTTLTTASSHFQILTGSTTQTFKLPDATSLSVGSTWIFDNDSTGNLYITDYANGPVDTVAPGGYTTVFLETNGTVAGEWGRFGMLPNEVNWGTLSADLGNTVITNATWNGNTIGTAYGGTGLTSFSSANYALYSTSSSALTAGTLPVAAGGTGATTLTGYTYGNGTGAFTASTTIPFSAITGTVPVNQGGTGQTSYTDGQLLIGNSSGNTLTKANLTAGTGISITNGGGSISIASTVTSGVTISDDTTTNATRYPLFTSATSGSVSTEYVSSTKYTYNPSVGTLSAPNIEATNGLFVNNATVSSAYTIPNGYNASSVGPVTVAPGGSVTIPAGSRWLVL